ncbi:MAG: diguanylate cyclase [Eubacterium sp.]|nr:diguanylate cyclase [Candidatus Colimonas fimequi]
MSSINELMYTTVPAIAFLCNLFLFSTLLTAKKNKAVYAFMGMLITFCAWTGGALFMRMELEPGVWFWWKVSLTGIFVAPYMIYLVASTFAETKGAFLKIIFGIITALIAVANGFDVFLTSPVIEEGNGHAVLHYSATIFAIIPLVFAVVVFATAYIDIKRSVKRNGLPSNYVTPFSVGVIIMVIGDLLDLVPLFNSLPMDSLGATINAVLIYYAFYKKRVYSLHQITSNGAMYMITVVITGFAVPVLNKAGMLVLDKLPNVSQDVFSMVLTVICAALAIVLYIVLGKLNGALFVKEQNRKEDLVKEFSSSVNTSLDVNSIFSGFLGLIRNETSAEHVYICRYDAEKNRYVSYNGMDTLEMPIVLLKSNPVINQIDKTNSGSLLYSEFKRSAIYKSMWEEEKRTLEYLDIELIIPFKNEGETMGFVLLSQKSGRKAYTFDEINFLESVASIASIALKNAQLYRQLEQEAKRDALTNLYNRRAFNERLNEAVNSSSTTDVAMILFNLDDFSLYNELYGNEEGDLMLQRFAGILTSVFGSKGAISRYGGKEFAVMLPHSDAETARQYAERVKVQLKNQIDSTKEATKKFLTFSAAICAYPSVASNANELMTYVNLAIFHIKQHGKNNIEIYNKQYSAQSAGKDKKEHIYELTSTIYALTAAIDAKDHYTFNHSRCVSEYATKLAEFAGLPSDYVEIIRQAGLLHDIGKISIPDAILTKQGKLTNEEFQIMRQHVERSIEMIRHLPALDYVIPAVVGHHERFDGKGYPRGIAGEDIPIGARCLSIADSFDAMVSRRSYKDKMSVEASLTEIMINLGKQFDPELGQLFVEKVRSGEIEVIDY